jgi:DNA-binding LacI/PurR family transcriptional regulator
MGNKSGMTIADIAKLAGVSKSTVSRALNDSPLISNETRERIKEIASERNFCISFPARQLSLKESRTIALVANSYYGKETAVEQLFGLEIMTGISAALSAKGYDMLVLYAHPNDTAWVRQYLDSGRVDGFIVLTPEYQHGHVRALKEMNAPFIIWGIPQAKCFCSSVAGDNFNGGRLATDYLLKLGRQRIAFLGGPLRDLEVQGRFAGYESALQEAGCPVDQQLLAYGDFSEVSGSEEMQNLLSKSPDLDAVFVNSDLMAIAAMDVIRETGRQVPQDVAVIGYDDLIIAEHCYPPLTTIRQNVPLAGKLLAQNLLQYLSTGAITNVTIPVELVIRKSA